MTDVLMNRSYAVRTEYYISLEECIKLCTDSPKCDFSEYRFVRSRCRLFGYDDARRLFRDAVSGDLYCNPGSRENCK